MLYQNFPQPSCCLCGSSEKLTGEHKIKAAALRKEFSEQNLIVFAMGEERERERKYAQSINSKFLKFLDSLCETCNTSRTKQADLEFDNFHRLALEKVESGEDPLAVFGLERYSKGSEPYLNVFRYFAKLLCCHLAEFGAPIPIVIARFALGYIDFNRIWLEVKRDPTYHAAKAQMGEHQYASHAGLVVYGDKKDGSPNALHSARTIGPVQYVFHMRLSSIEKIELQKEYPDVYERCRLRILDAIENPLSESILLKLGLRNGEN